MLLGVFLISPYGESESSLNWVDFSSTNHRFKLFLNENVSSVGSAWDFNSGTCRIADFNIILYNLQVLRGRFCSPVSLVLNFGRFLKPALVSY